MSIENFISAGVIAYIALPLLLLYTSKHLLYFFLLFIALGFMLRPTKHEKKIYLVPYVCGIIYGLCFFIFSYQRWIINYIDNPFIPSKLISPFIDLLFISLTMGIVVGLATKASIYLGKNFRKYIIKPSGKKK